MTEHNGHHCWNCWNVSLWIGNDYGLYRAALEAKRTHKTIRRAAISLMEDLPKRTPDGAKYTFNAVYRAIAGLE